MSIMAFLPKEKWRTCRWCGGRGERETSGDLHRSAGIVPCERFETYDAVSQEEYDRRREAGELYRSDGVTLVPPTKRPWSLPVVE